MRAPLQFVNDKATEKKFKVLFLTRIILTKQYFLYVIV